MKIEHLANSEEGLESRKKFPSISIASQNCLSLNISTRNNKTDLKILALTKSNHDIVLLCDIRLNSLKQSGYQKPAKLVKSAAIHDLEKKFKLKGYDFIHNSKSSSRGVGILIQSCKSYTIHNRSLDFNDNYILLDMSMDGFRFTIGSVYGPNRDEVEFFDNLKLDILNLRMNSNLIVLGGDWNATWDSNPTPVNIDVINMANIPSRRRSLQISALARSLSLTDAYRFLNPEKREFTFIPNILNNLNRSRLDFFLISENIVNDCKSSTIPHSLSSKLLDHKQITLSFKSERKGNLQKIKDTILKDKTLDSILLVYTYDTYINHSVICKAFPLEEKNRLTVQIGLLLEKLEEIKAVKIDGARTGNFIQANLILDQLALELNDGILALPGLDFFEGLALECSDVVFFETLAIILKTRHCPFNLPFIKQKIYRKIRSELN